MAASALVLGIAGTMAPVSLVLFAHDATGSFASASVVRDAELFVLVASLGDDVRERLGRAPLAGAERPAAPRSLEAARAFAEGLGALRRYEAERARGRFERAVELEPDNARYHAALSSAWQALQFPQKARDSAERAFALAGRLPQPERMFIEARHHQTARRFGIKAGSLCSTARLRL